MPINNVCSTTAVAIIMYLKDYKVNVFLKVTFPKLHIFRTFNSHCDLIESRHIPKIKAHRTEKSALGKSSCLLKCKK